MEKNRPMIGVAWMLASGFSFVALNAIVRYMGNDLPAAQNAFLRFAFGCVFLLPLIPRLRAEGITPRALRLFGLRGVLHTAGVVCWFYAMAHIPMAEVTAIGYLNPILVTLAAALIFGEKLSTRRLVAILVALVGAIVGEFVSSQRGLGYVIMSAQGTFDTVRVFAALFILAIMGMVLYGALVLLERRATPWRNDPSH